MFIRVHLWLKKGEPQMNTDRHRLNKATQLPLGLLINFGTPKVQIKRMLNDK